MQEKDENKNEQTKKCSFCGLRPGIVRFRTIINGAKKEENICEDCSSKQAFTPNLGDEIKKSIEDFIQHQKEKKASRPMLPAPTKTQQVKRSMIETLCINLSEKAEKGEIDPLIGREKEIKRLIEVLNRKKKNNPVLLGEPGVGKTAIAEGLALEILKGNVPDKIKNKKIYALNIPSLTKGTMYRGMFEERIEEVAKEAERRKDIILFVDEIHMLVGAGSNAENSMDAANILKPYLTGGKMKMIGATTFEEYRKIEKDVALSRRFEKIKISEPSVSDTIEILKGIKKEYEEVHRVFFDEKTIEHTVKLAERYFPEKNMPDKAIDLIDEVGSRLNLKHFEKENYHKVEPFEVELIIEDITGIPVTKINKNNKQQLSDIEERLKKCVIGQEEAIQQIARAVKRNRVGIKSKKKPVSFLFVGPTGVGKTELTKRLAVDLFGNDKCIIRLDMSEYMEKHTVAKIIGSPPGYVGYNEGGGLTEKVRKNPYSVILLDEIEKAHPSIQHIFLQIFDDGRLTDSHGTTIDFSHTLIIMTSNLGTEKYKSTGFLEKSNQDHFLESVKTFFKPEFINRLSAIVPFNHLKQEDIEKIVNIHLEELEEDLKEKGVLLYTSDKVKSYIAKLGYNEEYGARPLARVITEKLEDEIVELFIQHEDIKEIRIDIKEENLIFEM